MSYYLAVVSPLDSPLYEAQFATAKPTTAATNPSSSTGFPSWSTLAGAVAATSNSSTGPTSTALGSAALRPMPTRDSFPAALLGGNNVNGKTGGTGSNSERHVLQMIAHSSLDVVEDLMVGNGSL